MLSVSNKFLICIACISASKITFAENCLADLTNALHASAGNPEATVEDRTTIPAPPAVIPTPLPTSCPSTCFTTNPSSQIAAACVCCPANQALQADGKCGCPSFMVAAADGTCEPPPAPTPIPPPCYYAVYWTRMMRMEIDILWLLANITDTLVITGYNDFFVQSLHYYHQYSRETLVLWGLQNDSNYFDHSIAQWEKQSTNWSKQTFPNAKLKFLPNCPNWFSDPNRRWSAAGSTGDMFFDDNCNFVEPAGRFCGAHVMITASPVSLLWNSEADINEMQTLTTFQLNPDSPAKYFSWKASDKAPLLVFDPLHTGQITSAEQLFGNFTFGKRWSDGFAALASLDIDRDEKLSNEELTAIGLWFDINRNGVSEAGEVKSLEAVDVTALYFGPSRKESSTGDIYVFKGFERKDGNSVVIGTAVDWFGQPYATKEEFLNVINSLPRIEKATNSSLEQSTNLYTKQLDSPVAKMIDGIWLWKSESDDSSSFSGYPSGVLHFEAKEGDKIEGKSLVEIPLAKNTDGVKSMLRNMPLNGQVKQDAEGIIKLDFEVFSQRGLKTRTEAYILPNHSEMKGFSITEIGLDGTGKPITVEYAWSATKFQNIQVPD